ARTRFPHPSRRPAMRLVKRSRPGDVAKGALAGAAGGMVASWVMEKLMRRTKERDEGNGTTPQSHDPKVKVANALVQPLKGDEVAHPRRAGRIVHYAFGAGSAAVYGALAEVAPIVTLGFGALFGAAVWAAAPE